MTQRRPFKLQVEPIIEVIAETRFRRTKVEPLPLGLVYSAVAKEFPFLEQLPTSQFPFELRQADDGLRFSATHSAFNPDRTANVLFGDFSVAFGTRVYGGWESFRARAFPVLKSVLEQIDAKCVERASTRFINLLEGPNVEEQLKLTTLTIALGTERKLQTRSLHMRSEYAHDDSTTIVLQVGASATVQVQGQEPKNGSVPEVSPQIRLARQRLAA